MGVLDIIFSASEGLKRRARNVARDPAGALEQASDEIKRRLLTNPTEVALDAFNPPMMGGLAGVVKNEGGRWLAGSIPDAMQGLKQSVPGWANTNINDVAAHMGVTPKEVIDSGAWGKGQGIVDTPNGPVELQKALAAINKPRPIPPINSWLSKRLEPYIQNEMATPSDPLRLMADAWPEKQAALQAAAQARLDKIAADRARLTAERGVTPDMLTQLRQREIKAEKEKQLIDLQQGLHYAPGSPDITEAASKMRRSADGFVRTPAPNSPGSIMGKSPLGRAWEDVADSSIGTQPVSVRKQYEMQLGASPWMADLPDDTLVHHYNLTPTGFSHLTDELSNALNAESGLPAHLLLNPQQLNQLKVPQAAEHVAKINAWRAAQKAEADMVRANNAATHSIREYTDHPTLKGDYRWTQLKKAGDVADESALADALRYEGDTMQHCVGGYCPDVASGRSQIFSLRNTKTGQPHVTVEVHPKNLNGAQNTVDRGKWEEFLDSIGGPDNLKKVLKKNNPDVDFRRVSAPNVDLVQQYLPDVAKSIGITPVPPSIVQIKGVKNGKPVDEVLPYIQDFVKNPHHGGQWGEIGDLGNTGGLFKHPTGKYVSDADATALAQRHFGNTYGNKPDEIENARQYYDRVSRMAPEHLSDIDKGFIEEYKAGNFADGGVVTSKSATTGGVRGNADERHWSEYL